MENQKTVMQAASVQMTVRGLLLGTPFPWEPGVGTMIFLTVRVVLYSWVVFGLLALLNDFDPSRISRSQAILAMFALAGIEEHARFVCAMASKARVRAALCFSATLAVVESLPMLFTVELSFLREYLAIRAVVVVFHLILGMYIGVVASRIGTGATAFFMVMAVVVMHALFNLAGVANRIVDSVLT